MKKFQSFSSFLIVCFVSLSLFNFKAMADGEILSFDSETKQMLEKVVAEMKSGLHPMCKKNAENYVTICKTRWGGQKFVQWIIGRISCLIEEAPFDFGDGCEAAYYLLVLEAEKAIIPPEDKPTVNMAITLIRQELEDETTGFQLRQSDAPIAPPSYI